MGTGINQVLAVVEHLMASKGGTEDIVDDLKHMTVDLFDCFAQDLVMARAQTFPALEMRSRQLGTAFDICK